MKTEEELLALAEQYYPAGTEFTCTFSSTLKIRINSFTWKPNGGSPIAEQGWITCHGGIVYDKGKWALVNGIDPSTKISELDNARNIIYKD